MDTVETLIPSVAHVYSGQGLEAPVGREDPRIAVEGADGNEPGITLSPMVLWLIWVVEYVKWTETVKRSCLLFLLLFL